MAGHTMGRPPGRHVDQPEGENNDTTRSMEHCMHAGGSSIHIQHFITGFGGVLGVAFIFMMKYVEFASIEANAINFMMNL